jgi:hypothetical protein
MQIKISRDYYCGLHVSMNGTMVREGACGIKSHLKCLRLRQSPAASKSIGIAGNGMRGIGIICPGNLGPLSTAPSKKDSESSRDGQWRWSLTLSHHASGRLGGPIERVCMSIPFSDKGLHSL